MAALEEKKGMEDSMESMESMDFMDSIDPMDSMSPMFATADSLFIGSQIGSSQFVM